MSSFLVAAGDGVLNGTSEVTLVAAPGSGLQRLVKNVTVQNRDTAAVTVTLRYKNNASTRQLWVRTLQPGDTFVDTTPRCLDTTLKSITAVMSGAAATTNPDWQVNYAEVS